MYRMFFKLKSYLRKEEEPIKEKARYVCIQADNIYAGDDVEIVRVAGENIMIHDTTVNMYRNIKEKEFRKTYERSWTI